jgi:hypothetical protein
MITRILLALLGIFLCLQAAAGETPEERLQAAIVEFQQHTGDHSELDGKPGDLVAWNELWAALQAFVVDQMDHSVSPQTIQTHTPPLDNTWSGITIVPIGHNSYAVSANAGWFGNIFLIAKHEGHFRIVWDIRNSELGLSKWGWNYEAARGKCKQCRAAEGKVFALPLDAAGRPRFYIDAHYAQDAGATSGAQLSIWSFNGTTATAVLKKNYIVVADDEFTPTNTASLIKRHDKHEYRMFFACGSCLGRMLTWTINTKPEGISDLGESPDIPEADAVDEVFFRLWNNVDTKALASPEVLQQMGTLVAEEKARKYDPKFPTLGMLMSTFASRSQSHTKLTFDTDNEAAPKMVFSILHKKSGYYLEKLEIPPER